MSSFHLFSDNHHKHQTRRLGEKKREPSPEWTILINRVPRNAPHPLFPRICPMQTQTSPRGVRSDSPPPIVIPSPSLQASTFDRHRGICASPEKCNPTQRRYSGRAHNASNHSSRSLDSRAQWPHSPRVGVPTPMTTADFFCSSSVFFSPVCLSYVGECRCGEVRHRYIKPTILPSVATFPSSPPSTLNSDISSTSFLTHRGLRERHVCRLTQGPVSPV